MIVLDSDGVDCYTFNFFAIIDGGVLIISNGHAVPSHSDGDRSLKIAFILVRCYGFKQVIGAFHKGTERQPSVRTASFFGIFLISSYRTDILTKQVCGDLRGLVGVCIKFEFGIIQFDRIVLGVYLDKFDLLICFGQFVGNINVVLYVAVHRAGNSCRCYRRLRAIRRIITRRISGLVVAVDFYEFIGIDAVRVFIEFIGGILGHVDKTYVLTAFQMQFDVCGISEVQLISDTIAILIIQVIGTAVVLMRDPFCTCASCGALISTIVPSCVKGIAIAAGIFDETFDHELLIRLNLIAVHIKDFLGNVDTTLDDIFCRQSLIMIIIANILLIHVHQHWLDDFAVQFIVIVLIRFSQPELIASIVYDRCSFMSGLKTRRNIEFC